MFRYFKLSFFLLIFTNQLFAQKAVIIGRILDQDKYPVDMVSVACKETQQGTISNSLGRYEIEVPANIPITLVHSRIGFEETTVNLTLSEGERLKLEVSMRQTAHNIDEVMVIDERFRHSTTQYINPKLLKQMPSLSNPTMSIIKSLPGVSTNNELSSQYSVRGGNYDENLIYVNGIEIYKPFLVRSGQQEGMNFVNSDMIENLSFSSGGFEAKFGDKMSSVLDIEYRKPSETKARAEIGLLGGSALFEGTALKNSFSHISSVRLKQTKLLLKGLETQGNYDPLFFDFQTLLTYNFNEYLELSFLGYVSDNRYRFKPTYRETTLGMVNDAKRFTAYFDGQEIDRFFTTQGALSLRYNPSEGNDWKLSLSSFYSSESETFDIQGQYWLNEIDAQLGSTTLGDSIGSLAVGTYLDHARNYLEAVVSTATLAHKYRIENHVIQWGLSGRYDDISDKISEWMMLDSAGYSIPYYGFNDTLVELYETRKFSNSSNSYRMGAFIQDTWKFDFNSVDMFITAGLRYHYWSFNKESLFSPRGSIAVKPNWEKDWLFRLSTGLYYQPPFYKECIMPNGDLNREIKSQKSAQIVAAADYNFMLWNRRFKLVLEQYYKHLTDLIPYHVDNVRIIYDGRNHSNGYAYGFDFKLTGEFVKGVDSWLSLSLMKTEEDLTDDIYIRQINGVYDTTYPGFIPRPTDQRFTANLFFQDYWPGNPSIKVHLNAVFNTGLPIGIPDAPRHFSKYRYPGYKRIDMGISKEILRHNDSKRIMKYIESIWIGLDVFNIFDLQNTISYTWITDVRNRQHAIPNYLTGRLFNLKINATF